MGQIIMACFDTIENGRTEYTAKTILMLSRTVNWSRHRLTIIDNACCESSKNIFKAIKDTNININNNFTLITNTENVGTAKAINMGLSLRHPSEYCCKLDNDVDIMQLDWMDELEAAVERDPKIGVLGLKRKDLRQTPYDADENFRSELIQLSHELGQSWITVEKTNDIMGTCTLLNYRLLDVVGGYLQHGIYAFDDTLMNLKSRIAGFYNAFLSHIVIDHLDRGDNPYSKEKIEQANKAWEAYHHIHAGLIDGTIPLNTIS